MACPGVCGKQSLLACYIGTCSKKIQLELLFKSKRCSAPHSKIGNFSCRSWRRLLTKEKQDALVYTTKPSFSASQRKLTINKAVRDVKTSARLRSVRLKFMFRRVQRKSKSFRCRMFLFFTKLSNLFSEEK